jgi:hypothetical protein
MAIAWFCTMRRGLSEANKRVCLIQGGAALQIARGLKAAAPSRPISANALRRES